MRDGEAWHVVVRGVAKNRTWRDDWTVALMVREWVMKMKREHEIWCNGSGGLQPLLDWGAESTRNTAFIPNCRLSSVQFSCSVVSDSLWLYGLQHDRPPCPSPTPRVYSNSCPLSQWCHLTTSSTVIPFSSHLQSFPASGSFQMSQFFPIRWSKYWSFSFSISPSNEYSGLISFRMDWCYLLAVQGTLKSLLQYHSSKASILWCSAFFTVQFSHPYMSTGKTIALTRWTLVRKVMSLLFNMLSRLVIAFLPRSKHLLIFMVQSPSAVILEPPNIKCLTVSIVSPSICHEAMGCHDLSFLNVEL